MRAAKSIQRRFLLYLTLTSVTPIVLLTAVYINTSIRSAANKLRVSLEYSLRQISANADVRIEKMERTIGFAAVNHRVQEILMAENLDPEKGNVFPVSRELDSLVKTYFTMESNFRYTILFSGGGGSHSYPRYVPGKEGLRSAVWYAKLLEASGSIVWLADVPNPDPLGKPERLMVAGKEIRDITNRKDLAHIGAIAVFMDPAVFLDMAAPEQLVSSAVMVIANPAGDAMVRIPGDAGGSVTGVAKLPARALGTPTGSFREHVDGRDSLVLYHTSSLTGWKTVLVVPYGVLARETRFIVLFTSVLLLLVVGIISVISVLLSRRITGPIRRIAGAMEQVVARNLDVSVPLDGDDELGVISRGFNTMIASIQDQFNATREEERQKRKALVRAFRYQINPHFLFNALSSIRLHSLMNNDGKTAEVISVLCRILSNSLRSSDTVVTVMEEIGNLKDYIYIQQISHVKALRVSYDIEEGAMDYLVPSMVLQPIVENSIQHGLNEKLNTDGADAVLRIRCRATGDRLAFEVWDNGRGMETAGIPGSTNGKSIGLRNIQNRVQLEYGSGYGLQIESEMGAWTRVSLTLPVIRDGGAD
jgi:two-component system sensor histidine kinase YesM